jgi:2-oxoglutarate/2-oxoacid ferredoxin oxidoreductase subunit alpha
MSQENQIQTKSNVVIRFAGDSGDGIQLTGTQFTTAAAIAGNDLATFPDFPAEIRAPAGTLAGVSGFQLHFGSQEIFTSGDLADVLVVMNAAALKANLKQLKPGGIIIANEDGFDSKNLRLAKYAEGENPLNDKRLEDFLLYRVPVTKMTRTCLKEADTGLSLKDMDRCKNMFVLGLLFYMYNRPLDFTVQQLQTKFAKKPEVADANTRVLKAGYSFGDTIEVQHGRFEIKPAALPPGNYRSIMGNQATAFGLVAAALQAKLRLFYGTYPITPATDILHELARYKNFGVITSQAEDEIAAVTSAIGAAFGGSLAVTASSGPGISLKTEAIALAIMYELPLVICNVQRAGPSTGLPTKMEQADLMQAIYGRAGEAPLAVVAASTPSDCFAAAFEACRIAVEHMTPVFFLSDGYLANGAEPWRYPCTADLPEIKPVFATPDDTEDGVFYPYDRDERLVRKWAIPGTPSLEHRIGGLEKEDRTGAISSDPDNHQKMVYLRQQKIDNIALSIPLQELDSGPESGDLLVLGWGSTYGIIKTALIQLREEGVDVSHAHLRHLNPFPRNLEELLRRHRNILVPENNNGQLVRIIRDKFLLPAIPFNKIKGQPFTVSEMKNRIWEILRENSN